MPCSNCLRNGHNIRTCPDLQFNLIDDDLSYISHDDLDAQDVHMGMAKLIADKQIPPIECMVCYEDIEGEQVNLRCGHAYCVQCFIKHMRVGHNCAGCRAPICDPPKKTGSRTLSHSEISDLIDHNLETGPDFIGSVHADIIRQANKYIDENYGDSTETDRRRILVMMKHAIESTDLTFGFWIAGFSMAQNIIDAVTTV